MGSRVELFAAIRRGARVEELSIRELARRHGVHRRTVRQALAAAEPPPRKKPARSSPRLDPYKDAIMPCCPRTWMPLARRSPGTAASTSSWSTSSATWNSTPAAPSSSSSPHRREEKNSIAIASKPILLRLDRHLHRPPPVRRHRGPAHYHGTIIETGTHSYRLAHARSQHG